MEKQKSWQLYLIIAVIALTLYNIFPTIFYYSKPLKSPVDEKRAEQVAVAITERVNSLEQEAVDWLYSYSKLLGVKASSINIQPDNPRLIEVAFQNSRDANVLRRFLPRAGSMISFVPAQLTVAPDQGSENPNSVLVVRQIGVHLDPNTVNETFQFALKENATNGITPFYREISYDRLAELTLALAGPSPAAIQLSLINENPSDSRFDDMALVLAKEILDVESTLGDTSPAAQRYFASFSQSTATNPAKEVEQYLARIETIKTAIEKRRTPLLKEQTSLEKEGLSLDHSTEQLLSSLTRQKNTLERASGIIRKNSTVFEKGLAPLTREEILKQLAASEKTIDPKDPIQTLNLQGRNPFIEALTLDWTSDTIKLDFYPEVQKVRNQVGTTEKAAYTTEKLNQLIFNVIARASRLSDETISPEGDTFGVALNTLTNTQSLLAFDLGVLAEKQVNQLTTQLESAWTPQHGDLAREQYPIYDYATYQKLTPAEQKLALVVYAPAMYTEAPPKGFKKDSIYVIARGLDAIMGKYTTGGQDTSKALLHKEVEDLGLLLQKEGFIGYKASAYGMPKEFRQDFIFELDNYYAMLLNATREDFTVHGSKRYAVLDFSDVEQRIITENRIDDAIQEDLIKWRDEYSAAQVDLNITSHYLIPPPTKNAYWENFKLSVVKYFRGDDRKILKWGLDLSGGKTVRIGLRDQNNRRVTNPDDLRTTVNELYKRINTMGVSEQAIRIENENIILDFPGSQGLSADELIKASAMYFHIVNEKFTPNNTALKEQVNEFLQTIWNEAVVTNRKDVQSINEIAWEHLGGNSEESASQPRSEAARILYENGLRLPNPHERTMSPAFDDTLSIVSVMRGNDYSEWNGQTHPLLIVFNNFALEGANLTNIQIGYDATEGNMLSFNVGSSSAGSEKGSGNPRDNFYAWTSQFAEEKIQGTPKEAYSQGRGWRMAVILNGQVITQPSLRAALRDGATISGRFSQREINQLAADLKAGSLSFTPFILSEHNVSPELGLEERTKGIIASLIGLLAVVVAMVAYYRFAGVVASCAVILNILIMWGVLQNLDAALTLPGIAGIVLTIGMAVDANVLVFERIREEFKVSGRIASAIQAGYRKAFSAIIDSNVTTIIAALILIQFDSGPIKGFAITLIIGIVSSMFTALFMTRYFFAGWVQNPKHKALNMAQMIGETHFNFLGQAKKALTLSVVIMLVGSYLFIAQRNTIFGMDFTGGYSMMVELEEQPGDPSYRLETLDALVANGASPNAVQVRELNVPNQLLIQLGVGMEEQGYPFYQMPKTLDNGKVTYTYETNPRITWVVDSLAKGGLKIQQSNLETLNNDWTVMSGQFSEAMRNNAIMALSLALFSILCYITIRFEFKYAIGAVIALAHDVILTLGIVSLFHYLGFAVQIDLEVIGAIMTIIGYSLNDTIIIFDRIREDLVVLRKMKFADIINHALNVTLSRTIMTSGTTLLVLLTLVLLGGPAIFGFSLVMTVGVVVGTFSSLFIAGPVMLFFHNREMQQQDKLKLKKA